MAGWKCGELFNRRYVERTPMQKTRATRGLTAADRAAFDGPFLAYLRRRGLAPKSIERIFWGVRYAGRWLARRHQSLVRLRARHAPALLAASAAEHWGWIAQKDYKSCLASWFRFREPAPVVRVRRRRWVFLVDSFVHFLEQHRGLAPRTRRAYRDIITRYLEWQFASRALQWNRVTAEDVWRYADSFRRGRRFSTLNHDLCRLRRFFSFLQMRGFPAGHLIPAVPRYSNYGRSREPEILDDAQRRALLVSFDRKTAIGARDYCIAVAMVDLGLRPIEVARLTLADVRLTEAVVTIPALKSASSRELPLVARVHRAFEIYARDFRPNTMCDRFFLRLDAKRYAMPMDSRAVGFAMKAAFRRCKFPERWAGCYRLRHTFATRLHARGADLKHIADLLGHRHIQTTTIYAKVDPVGLRALALPWPIR